MERNPGSLKGLGGIGQKNKRPKVSAVSQREILFASRGWSYPSMHQCEIPSCSRLGVEPHHTRSSYRGPRKHDPREMLWVCRECHTRITHHNTQEMQDFLSNIAQGLVEKKK